MLNAEKIHDTGMFFDFDCPSDDPNSHIFSATISSSDLQEKKEKLKDKEITKDIVKSLLNDQTQTPNTWIDNNVANCPDWFSFDEPISKQQEKMDYSTENMKRSTNTHIEKSLINSEEIEMIPKEEFKKKQYEPEHSSFDQMAPIATTVFSNENHFWDRLNDDFDSLNQKIKILGLKSPEKTSSINTRKSSYSQNIEISSSKIVNVTSPIVEQTVFSSLGGNIDREIIDNRQEVDNSCKSIQTKEEKEISSCNRCFKNNLFDSNFCSSCGNKLNRFVEYPDTIYQDEKSNHNQENIFIQQITEKNGVKSPEYYINCNNTSSSAVIDQSKPFISDQIDQERNVLQAFDSKHLNANFHHDTLTTHFPKEVNNNSDGKAIDAITFHKVQNSLIEDSLNIVCLMNEVTLKSKINEKIVTQEANLNTFWIVLKVLLDEKKYGNLFYENLKKEFNLKKMTISSEDQRSFTSIFAKDSISFIENDLINADIKGLCSIFLGQKAWFNALFFSALIDDDDLRKSILKAIVTSSEIHWTDPLSFYILSNIKQFEIIGIFLLLLY